MKNELIIGQADTGLAVPETDDELWEMTRDILGIELPREACCDHHVPPFRAYADAYFARYPVIIVQASRGLGGKSVLMAALAMMEAITYGAAVNLLGGSLEQSRRIHDYQTGENDNIEGAFWSSPNAPRELVIGDLYKYQTKLKNGGRINVLTASQKSVRGPHPQRLRMDEIDDMDLDIFDAAMGQPQAARGIEQQTLAGSTHHKADGTFTEVKQRAADKGWPIYEWCYRENLTTNGGWLPPEEVEVKRQTVTEQMWEVEYENQEPSIEDRALVTERVEQMFNRELGVFEGRMDKPYVFEEYHRDHKYVIAADWAKKQHFTIILVWRYDTVPYRLVAFLRTGRKEWPDMIADYKMMKDKYHITKKRGGAFHDETGLGNVVADYVPPDSEGINFGKPALRKQMLNDYTVGIEANDFEAPHIKFMYSEHKYATNDDLYGRGHLPDTIAAGAMSSYGINKSLARATADDVDDLGEVEEYESLWE